MAVMANRRSVRLSLDQRSLSCCPLSLPELLLSDSYISSPYTVSTEFMGIVEAVGPEVVNIKPGMRVVVAFPIADGTCEYCKRGEFTLCETTNDSQVCKIVV